MQTLKTRPTASLDLHLTQRPFCPFSPDITEEDLYAHFEAVGSVECVQKPSQNYAYVSFKDNASIKAAMELKKSLKGIEPYIVEVKRKISMFLEQKKAVAYASIRDKCDKLDLVYDPDAEHETTCK